MAARATSPVSHAANAAVPVEVEQHDIGTPTRFTWPATAPPAADGTPMPQTADEMADVTAPPGIPLIPPVPPSSISDANFQRMMDFWQEVANRQEQRIQELVEQVANMQNENPKKHDAKLTLPAIDIKNVKKTHEYDGDEKASRCGTQDSRVY